jgi:hypothetical protein
LARLAFGPWLPDRNPLAVGDTGLLRAENAIPYGAQYRGFPGWRALTLPGATGADARVRGSIAGTKSDGTPYHFAGDVEKLYELRATGLVNVSAPGSPAYSLASRDLWCFTQYGDTVIACGGLGQKPQGFLMGTHTSFTSIDNPAAPGSGGFSGSGTAPTGRYPWVIGKQLFIANLSADENAMHWSVNENPNGWPAPGSGAAVSGLSDTVSLGGGGTRIQAIRGYGEVGGILKDESLWRADFVGGDVFWEFRQMVEGVGLLIPNLAIPFEGQVLFCSEHGWKLWAYGSEIVPVGDSVIDRWFRNNYDPLYPERFSWAVDQDESLAYVLYVGSGNVGGEPNRMLVYHWPTRQFATIEAPGIEHVSNAFQPTMTITVDTMTQTPIDSLQGSPDDETGAPQKVHLAGYEIASHDIGLFDGALAEATLETGDVSHAPGERATVGVVRPMVDTDEYHAARVTVGVRSSRTASIAYSSEEIQKNDGECYFRQDGRYHRYRVRVPSGAVDIQAMGLEVDFEADGSQR